MIHCNYAHDKKGAMYMAPFFLFKEDMMRYRMIEYVQSRGKTGDLPKIRVDMELYATEYGSATCVLGFVSYVWTYGDELQKVRWQWFKDFEKRDWIKEYLWSAWKMDTIRIEIGAMGDPRNVHRACEMFSKVERTSDKYNLRHIFGKDYLGIWLESFRIMKWKATDYIEGSSEMLPVMDSVSDNSYLTNVSK